MEPQTEETSEREDWLEEGDLSQIREMLDLTPEERLMAIQSAVNSAIEIRTANGDKSAVTVSFVDLLKVLSRHDVELIVVDGVASILVGLPIMSSKLEILIRTTADNYKRLSRALKELNAQQEDPSSGRHTTRRPTWNVDGRLSLVTDFGGLEIMQRISDDLTYPKLIDESKEIELAGFTVHVLSLEAQINVRERAQRLLDGYFLIFLRNLTELKGLRLAT